MSGEVIRFGGRKWIVSKIQFDTSSDKYVPDMLRLDLIEVLTIEPSSDSDSAADVEVRRSVTAPKAILPLGISTSAPEEDKT